MRKEEIIEKVTYYCDSCKNEIQESDYDYHWYFSFAHYFKTPENRGLDLHYDMCEDCAKKLVEDLKGMGIEGEYR